jgi:crotonobetainyl-CoA:carnitine CoA-transferase CaiB-like acyl-CoA transferase
MSAGPAGPLSGVTVLDLSSYLAGPYGCTLLADLGANVIKIEAPQSDMLRQFPSSLPGADSRFFVGANRGKRALSLDLKQPEGLAVLHRMVRTADVLVENFRPSVPARLGIDYPRLKKLNPRLVYCGLTGFGEHGPLAEKGGFDRVLQCLSGIAVFQGGGVDKPQLVLGSVLDYFTSALLAYGVAAALFHRERSGAGQYLSLSLLRSALTIQAGRFVWADSEGRHVTRDALYFRPFQSFLRGAVRIDRTARAGSRPTLRDDANAGCACSGVAAGTACCTRHPLGPRMGRTLRGARAVRGGAADRGHVRPSAGNCRRVGNNCRSSDGRPIPHDD